MRQPQTLLRALIPVAIDGIWNPRPCVYLSKLSTEGQWEQLEQPKLIKTSKALNLTSVALSNSHSIDYV